MTIENIDSLIHARWIIPVEPHDIWYEHYSVAVKNGKIHDLLPSDQARQKYRATSNHELDTHVLIPGLINAHTHTPMTLFRGMADDLPLMEWLEKHIWPAEATWVNPEFVECGASIAIAEMLMGGTTCFSDMYFFPNVVAKVADTAGIRAMVGLIVLGFPTVWAKDGDEYIHKGLEIHDQYRSNTLIRTAFAPHAPYTVPDEPLRRVATLAEELDIPIQMHIHETITEVQDSKLSIGKTPIHRLNDLGLLTPRLMAVHMTVLDEQDTKRIVESGAHIVHCPESNLKLASGFCAVQNLIDEGINIALGTDGAASNNDLDMLGEMRTAALLAKAVAKSASALPAATALRMATLNGAQAMGLDDQIGSLTIGKSADIVAINLNHIATQPVYNPISQLIYAATRDQVTDVWVAGTQLLKDRTLTTIEIAPIIAEAQAWAERIREFDHSA